jgi:hypothetical protein
VRQYPPLSGLIMVGLSSIMIGCQPPPPAPEPRQAATSHFSILTDGAASSILPALKSTSGHPTVCLALLGFDDGAVSDATNQLQALLSDSANKWNALLQGYTGWTVQTIEPKFSVKTEQCTPLLSGADFNVNVWGDVDRFQAEFCALGGGVCASTTAPSLKTMWVGPWNRTEEVDPLDPFTILHEYGHLLGLGDTYRIPGANDWEGEQPPSVMNRGSTDLTQDDQLGLWVSLRTVETGARSCDGFGTEMTMTANASNVLMCDPNATPQSSDTEN